MPILSNLFRTFLRRRRVGGFFSRRAIPTGHGPAQTRAVPPELTRTLLRASGNDAAATSAAPASSTPVAAPSVPPDARARDTSRTRDRESR